MRSLVLCLSLSACGAAPAPAARHAPPIPTTQNETWRCVSPGGAFVLVVGTPEPRRVDLAGVPLDCYLVPIGE